MEQEQKKYSLYIHKNKINGKCYVGITKQPPNKRWKKGKGYSTQKYFYNAILKYGWENFDHVILLQNLLEEDAKRNEKLYISILKSDNSSFGYNMTPGGDSVNANCCKEVYQYSIDGAFIKSYESVSEAMRQTGITTINACCNGYVVVAGNYRWAFKDNNPNMSTTLTGSKRVKQYTIDGKIIEVFESANVAAIKTNSNVSHIISCCNNKRNTANDYVWSYYDKTPNFNFIPYKRKVSQYDLNNNYIDTYNSINDAQSITGIMHISNCCNYRRKTAGKYIWRYAE